MSGSVNDWKDLEASLDGAFSARAKGFLGSEYSLRGGDGEFGTLRLEGSDNDVSFEAGDLRVRVEQAGSRYRMLTGAEETLTAERKPSGGLFVESDGASLEASMSLVRNAASARSTEGRELVHVSGGLMNRSYEVSFEEGSLTVAVFLLHYTAALRRRAFRVGSSNAVNTASARR